MSQYPQNELRTPGRIIGWVAVIALVLGLLFMSLLGCLPADAAGYGASNPPFNSAAAQTLSNKTLASPVFTGPVTEAPRTGSWTYTAWSPSDVAGTATKSPAIHP